MAEAPHSTIRTSKSILRRFLAVANDNVFSLRIPSMPVLVKKRKIRGPGKSSGRAVQ
jgi:hypothetical protein